MKETDLSSRYILLFDCGFIRSFVEILQKIIHQINPDVRRLSKLLLVNRIIKIPVRNSGYICYIYNQICLNYWNFRLNFLYKLSNMEINSRFNKSIIHERSSIIFHKRELVISMSVEETCSLECSIKQACIISRVTDIILILNRLCNSIGLCTFLDISKLIIANYG